MAKKYGMIGLERWRATYHQGVYLHVLLDGQEVTTNCRWCDDIHGVVRLFKVNANGQKYVEPGTDHVAMQTCYGDVVIVPECVTPDPDTPTRA